MNKMEELAKLLGVELEEEFDIETDKLINRCKLTKDGICLLHNISNKYILGNVDVCKLLTGEYKIKKLPWKAKLDECYYTPDLYDKDSPFDIINGGLGQDSISYKRGLMCKTIEQAKELAELLIKTAREFQGFDEEEQEYE